jgi:hypothetical protein
MKGGGVGEIIEILVGICTLGGVIFLVLLAFNVLRMVLSVIFG